MNFKCVIFKCLWFLSCPSLYLRLIMIWTARHGAIMYMWWDPPVSQAPPGCSLLSLSLAVSQPWSWASHDWRYVSVRSCRFCLYDMLHLWTRVFIYACLFDLCQCACFWMCFYLCPSVCQPRRVWLKCWLLCWRSKLCLWGLRLHCWRSVTAEHPLQMSWVQDTSLTYSGHFPSHSWHTTNPL